MNPAKTAVSKLLVPTLRSQVAQRFGGSLVSAKDVAIVHGKTMDQLPSPQGDWTSENGKRQTKYNLHLLASLGAFGLTFALAQQCGCFYVAEPDMSKPCDIYEDMPEVPEYSGPSPDVFKLAEELGIRKEAEAVFGKVHRSNECSWFYINAVKRLVTCDAIIPFSETFYTQ